MALRAAMRLRAGYANASLHYIDRTDFKVGTTTGGLPLQAMFL
jgi:hypothetical protein